MTDDESPAEARRRGLLLAVGGPVLTGLAFLGAFVLADLDVESIPRALAAALGLGMGGGVVMTYAGLWTVVTGRTQKQMSRREKTVYFLGFVLFVVLGVVAFVSFDTFLPSGPQGVRGVPVR